jgi:hypothetical protein
MGTPQENEELLDEFLEEQYWSLVLSTNQFLKDSGIDQTPSEATINFAADGGSPETQSSLTALTDFLVPKADEIQNNLNQFYQSHGMEGEEVQFVLNLPEPPPPPIKKMPRCCKKNGRRVCGRPPC